MIGKALFWSSLGALVWTQAGYPLFAAALFTAVPAFSQQSQAPTRVEYPTKQVAAYQDYLRRSNEMARRILLVQAEFSPEQLRHTVFATASKPA